MKPITGLALVRLAIGGVAFASPALGAKLFRLDADGNPQLPYMARMFASREVALGILTLTAPATVRRQLIALGVAVDAADTVAAIQAVRSGAVSPMVGVGLTAPAIGAVGAGIAGLVTES